MYPTLTVIIIVQINLNDNFSTESKWYKLAFNCSYFESKEWRSIGYVAAYWPNIWRLSTRSGGSSISIFWIGWIYILIYRWRQPIHSHKSYENFFLLLSRSTEPFTATKKTHVEKKELTASSTFNRLRYYTYNKHTPEFVCAHSDSDFYFFHLLFSLHRSKAIIFSISSWFPILPFFIIHSASAAGFPSRIEMSERACANDMAIPRAHWTRLAHYRNTISYIYVSQRMRYILFCRVVSFSQLVDISLSFISFWNNF